MLPIFLMYSSVLNKELKIYYSFDENDSSIKTARAKLTAVNVEKEVAKMNDSQVEAKLRLFEIWMKEYNVKVRN